MTMRELLGEAERAGIRNAEGMTPGELEGALLRLARRREEKLRDMDTLAWLIGRYNALAFHAPLQYPSRPDAVRIRRRETEEELRAFFRRKSKEM